MSDIYGYILALVIAAIAGIFFGWIAAHDTVSRECNRLGSFYVGNITYQCKAVAP